MKRNLRLLFSIAGLFVLCVLFYILHVSPKQIEDRRRINEAGFTQIEKSTDWDIKSNMLWGYFFTNKYKTPLEILSVPLRIFGYRTVDVRYDKEGQVWWLHTEKIQINSLEELSVRDVRFKRIASLVFSSDYDGWDVGKVSSN